MFGDARGFFLETWERRKFAAGGIDADFVQDNHSRSVQHTLRGLHYQVAQPQGKLVRVVSGAVFDVAVDLRRSSPTFGRWVGAELTAENNHMLWVPPGFAHGFLVAQRDRLISSTSAPTTTRRQAERCIRWDDPAARDRLAACRQAPRRGCRPRMRPVRLFARRGVLSVKVLLTGARGQVGARCRPRRRPPHCAGLTALAHDELDIGDRRRRFRCDRALIRPDDRDQRGGLHCGRSRRERARARAAPSMQAAPDALAQAAAQRWARA